VGIGVYLFNVLAGKGDAEEGAERLRSGGSKYWQAQFHDYFFVFERRILLVLFVFVNKKRNVETCSLFRRARLHMQY
jgi:hypothetical protein